MQAKLKVKLIRHTPDAEELIAGAAKLCYSAVGIDEITDRLTPVATEKFLNMLTSIGHGSPFEHASFTFALEGVSRALTHQLVRHRIASFSQQSQRYVKLKQFEYIIPPAIEQDEEAKKLFIEAMERDQETYDKIVDILQQKTYDVLVSEYMSTFNIETISDMPVKTLDKFWKDAEKIAIEDARYVFPNACETKIIVTMNAREFMHFCHHRCCNRAQWEIRDAATEMLRQARDISPTLFKLAGPSCLYGACSEGGMSCGKAKEVREKFAAL